MAFFSNLYGNAFFIGFVSTIVMTVFMIISKNLVRGVKMDLLTVLGETMKKWLGLKLSLRITQLAGLLVHLLVGSSLGLFYYLVSVSSGYNMNIISGMTYSVLPWLVMMLLMFPALGHGMWGSKLGRKLKIEMLILHLVYGAVLGYLAGM